VKYDKETITVIVICVILLLAWPSVYQYLGGDQGQAPSAAQAPAAEASAQPVQEAAQSPESKQSAQEAPKAAEKAPVQESERKDIPTLPDISLDNGLASFSIDPNKGDIREVKLDKFKMASGKDSIVIGLQSPEGAFRIGGLDGWTLSSVSAAKSSPSSASVTRAFKKGESALSIVQSFSLGDSYVLKCDTAISASGPAPVKIPALSVSAGGIPPIKHLGGDKVTTDPHRVDLCFSANKHVRSFDPSVSDEKFRVEQTVNPLDWVGSSNKYFATLLLPETGAPFTGGCQISRANFESKAFVGDKYFLPSISGVYKDLELKPGSKSSFSLSYYAGPKEMGIIKKELPETALEILHISYWSWFEFLARPLLWLLNWLHSYCGSYGISIILLTLIVRIVFWPITQKANKSMRKMQKLQPQVQELREKYKDDSQTMNMKMMELYKKEKVNPLGGCLPMLLQLPVFFALYSALDASVELRQVPFLWAADLSKPDLVGPLLLFGVGIHPLVIAMTILMVIQQKLTPAMGDPMQQKMLMVMPVVMLVLLYSLPSGLTLYWTISNAFSIIQLKYNLYVNKREDEMNSPKAKTA